MTNSQIFTNFLNSGMELIILLFIYILLLYLSSQTKSRLIIIMLLFSNVALLLYLITTYSEAIIFIGLGGIISVIFTYSVANKSVTTL